LPQFLADLFGMCLCFTCCYCVSPARCMSSMTCMTRVPCLSCLAAVCWCRGVPVSVLWRAYLLMLVMCFDLWLLPRSACAASGNACVCWWMCTVLGCGQRGCHGNACCVQAFMRLHKPVSPSVGICLVLFSIVSLSVLRLQVTVWWVFACANPTATIVRTSAQTPQLLLCGLQLLCACVICLGIY
jgi:hypothetical protein